MFSHMKSIMFEDDEGLCKYMSDNKVISSVDFLTQKRCRNLVSKINFPSKQATLLRLTMQECTQFTNLFIIAGERYGASKLHRQKNILICILLQNAADFFTKDGILFLFDKVDANHNYDRLKNYAES